MKKKYDILYFTILFAVCLKLAFDLNFPEGKPVSPGVIWSDEAAYYIYLPALFLYDFEARKFPDESIGKKSMGYGFDISYKENKIKTRMTYGVAVMISPFFLATMLMENHSGPDAGFSLPFQKATVVAGVFYLVSGLFLIRRFLLRYISPVASWITVLALLFTTNLYFYGIRENLMSHVYSFFLYSVLLNLLPNPHSSSRVFPPARSPLPAAREEFSIGKGLLVGLVAGLLILIRPTNFMLVFILLFFDVTGRESFFSRLRMLTRPRFLIPSAGIVFLVMLPQFFYWKYWSGHYIFYSYGQQGFSNLTHPPILSAWFSPLNGLFLYTPLFLMITAGIILMILRKIHNGWFLLLFFLAISYLFASWDQWYYGGSYGWRPMVEYYALFSLPLGFIFNEAYRKGRRWWLVLLTVFLIVFTFTNLRMIYHHRWFTGSVWSWGDFRRNLAFAGLTGETEKSYTHINDYENHTVHSEMPLTREISRSGQYAAILEEYTTDRLFYLKPVSDLMKNRAPRWMEVSFWARPERHAKTGARLGIELFSDGWQSLGRHDYPVDLKTGKPGSWNLTTVWYRFPPGIVPWKTILTVTLYNDSSRTVYVDDFRIRFFAAGESIKFR